MYLLSSVTRLSFEFLKELIWFKYLVLKVFPVSPTQVSCFMLSSLVTVAWQTIPSVWHFPESGQVFIWRQFQFQFVSYVVVVAIQIAWKQLAPVICKTTVHIPPYHRCTKFENFQPISSKDNNEVFLRVTNHTEQVEKNLLGPAGIRTRDLRFTSPMLYQLSYRSSWELVVK